MGNKRLLEENFRRYEKAIAHVLANWPTKVTFNPAPFSVETFACRLRDAMKSMIDYEWKSTLVDLEKLKKLRPLLAVVSEELVVAVQQKKKDAPEPVSAGKPVKESEVVVPEHLVTKEVVDSFACLLHHRLLSFAVIFPTTGVGAEEMVLETLTKWDVGVIPSDLHISIV